MSVPSSCATSRPTINSELRACSSFAVKQFWQVSSAGVCPFFHPCRESPAGVFFYLLPGRLPVRPTCVLLLFPGFPDVAVLSPSRLSASVRVPSGAAHWLCRKEGGRGRRGAQLADLSPLGSFPLPGCGHTFARERAQVRLSAPVLAVAEKVPDRPDGTGECVTI